MFAVRRVAGQMRPVMKRAVGRSDLATVDRDSSVQGLSSLYLDRTMLLSSHDYLVFGAEDTVYHLLFAQHV